MMVRYSKIIVIVNISLNDEDVYMILVLLRIIHINTCHLYTPIHWNLIYLYPWESCIASLCEFDVLALCNVHLCVWANWRIFLFLRRKGALAVLFIERWNIMPYNKRNIIRYVLKPHLNRDITQPKSLSL